MAQNQFPSQNQDQLSTYLLTVADSPAAREELALNLASVATAKIWAATSYNSAVAELRQPDRRIDLAIIDLEMAGSAAVTLTRKLRDPHGFKARNLAILLIGGKTNTPTYQACARLGIQGHLPRPYTTERLRQAVRDALLARPTQVKERKVVVARDDKLTAEPVVVAPEPAAPFVPVANKPFQHGIQSLMRVVESLSPDEAFGFEPVRSVPLSVERKPKPSSNFLFAGRKLSAVG